MRRTRRDSTQTWRTRLACRVGLHAWVRRDTAYARYTCGVLVCQRCGRECRAEWTLKRLEEGE